MSWTAAAQKAVQKFGAPSARVSWRGPLLGAAIVWVAIRIVLTADAVLAHLNSRDGLLARPDWFLRLFAQWDSAYYEGIARFGYAGRPSTWAAFFPGYPVVARALGTAFGGFDPSQSQLAAGLWTAIAIASLVAAVLLWRFVEAHYGRPVALAATVLLLAGPYGFVLDAFYAEALFLAFAIPAWMLVARGNWIAGGILAALAAFTRINGLFLAVALAVLLVLELRGRGRPFILRAIALLALAASGAVAYFGYLFVRTGDPFAWSHAESAGWQRSFQWPWKTYYHTVLIVAAAPPDQKLQYTMDVLFGLMLIVALVLLIRRRQWPEVVYLGLTAVSLMTSSDLQSLARDTVTLFPLTILVASTLLSARWRWVYWAVAVVGFGLLLVNAHLFTLGYWAD